MTTFKIPVEYKVWGLVEVQADSLEEAFTYAINNIDELELPDRPEYVEDSYEIAADNIHDLEWYNQDTE